MGDSNLSDRVSQSVRILLGALFSKCRRLAWQDTQNRFIQEELNFSCVKEVVTVWSFLEEKGALELLQDPLVLIATRDITDKGGKKSREAVAADVQMKQWAGRELQERFRQDGLTANDVQRILDSIADMNNYLTFNVGPVRRMIRNLTNHFDPERPQKDFSLAIGYGARPRGSRGSFSFYGRSDNSGAKLSHDHPTQFTYVHQSLKLWKVRACAIYQTVLSDPSFGLL
jgi:hypothetical protein